MIIRGKQKVSAAKAYFKMEGKSPTEAWERITSMFNNGPLDESFIPLCFCLESIKKQHPNKLSVGDTFKYTMNHGTEAYIRIVEASQPTKLVYDDITGVATPADIKIAMEGGSIDRMKFTLQAYPEGTLVKIARAETWHTQAKKLSELLLERAFERRTVEDKDHAVFSLNTIFSTSANRHYKPLVERDDAYRLDF